MIVVIIVIDHITSIIIIITIIIINLVHLWGNIEEYLGTFSPLGLGCDPKCICENWVLFFNIKRFTRDVCHHMFLTRTYTNKLLFHSDSIWTCCWAQPEISTPVSPLISKSTLWRDRHPGSHRLFWVPFLLLMLLFLFLFSSFFQSRAKNH